MKQSNAIFKMQLRHMLARTEFKLAFTIVLLVITASYCELGTQMFGLDKSQVYSSAYGWVGNPARLRISTIQMFYLLLIFLVGAMAFADSQYVDGKIRARGMVITRCSSKSYILSGALLSFLGAFFVVFIPFLFSLLLPFVMFPFNSYTQYVYNWQDLATWNTTYLYPTIFPHLFYYQPYLYNFISAVYVSFCAAAVAAFSFALSLFISKGRLLVLGLPTILLIVSEFFTPPQYIFSYYLDIGFTPGQCVAAYLLWPLGFLAVSALLTGFKIRFMRDEL